MAIDLTALVEATKAKKIVLLVYQKKDKATGLHTGEIVMHTGGVYEIKPDGTIWLWDTQRNDCIRQFKPDGVQSFEVLAEDFIPNGIWPIKINGEIIL
jgi:WD40 repeat protein